MTLQEAIDYIENYTWSESRLGLDRTYGLLAKLANPQNSLKFVHVAGTNGKGSTCAMVERILRAAGFRTGFYPSPFIEDFRERIQVNGEYITEEALTRITEQVSRVADAMEDHPSQFEIITAIGMLYFAEMHCDIVVLEVGLGGALDSTNVISAPLVAVITNIGLDHTEYLGDTVEKIAKTKAGIIKPGTYAVSYKQVPGVEAVLREDCQEKGVPISFAEDFEKLDHSLDGQRFKYKGKTYELGLLGVHQLRNATTVLEIIEALKSQGYKISDEDIAEGLKEVKWPARFEVLGKDPLFILDGGHNPQCAEALTESIREYIADPDKGQKVTFLIGMLADKDYDTTLELLRPFGANYVCITPESPRALKAAELAKEIERIAAEAGTAKAGAAKAGTGAKAGTAENTIKPNVTVCEDIAKAIPLAESFGLPTIAFGSLYSAGTIRRTFRNLNS